MTIVSALHVASLVLLVGAATLALFRMAEGPTSLDRSIASDVLIAILLAGVGLYTIHFENSHGLTIMVVLSLLGFTAAVGMARLLANRSDQVRVLRDRRTAEPELGDSRPDPWEEAETAADVTETNAADGAGAGDESSVGERS